MDRPLREGVSYNRDTGDRTSAPAPPPPPPAVATAYPDNDDVGNVDWNPNRAICLKLRMRPMLFVLTNLCRRSRHGLTKLVIN